MGQHGSHCGVPGPTAVGCRHPFIDECGRDLAESVVAAHSIFCDLRVHAIAWTLADPDGVDRPGLDQIGRALYLRSTTIAFLAGGLDRFYPSGHDALLARIVEHGAAISEVPCGGAPTKWRFLQRKYKYMRRTVEVKGPVDSVDNPQVVIHSCGGHAHNI